MPAVNESIPPQHVQVVASPVEPGARESARAAKTGTVGPPVGPRMQELVTIEWPCSNTTAAFCFFEAGRQIPAMSSNARGPVALVTGASEGIGRAIALALGGAGYRIAVTARTSSKLEGVVGDLERAGVVAVALPADVGDPEQVEAMVRKVGAELGPIEVLVNNAGVAFTKPFLETSLEEWDRTFATNVRALFLVTRAVLPGMRALGRGDIVNIGSLAGKNGVANAVAYSASKHAVLGFGRSLMLEVRKEGIRVITICPGSVDTPLLRNATAFSPAFDRILEPDDVAATVVDALKLPRRAMVSELDVRPTNP